MTSEDKILTFSDFIGYEEGDTVRIPVRLIDEGTYREVVVEIEEWRETERED